MQKLGHFKLEKKIINDLTRSTFMTRDYQWWQKVSAHRPKDEAVIIGNFTFLLKG